jgi:hypothetical protein
MTRSVRAREVRALRLPRWLRARGEHPTDARSDPFESGSALCESGRFGGHVNASLGRIGGAAEGGGEMLSRWS